MSFPYISKIEIDMTKVPISVKIDDKQIDMRIRRLDIHMDQEEKYIDIDTTKRLYLQ